MADFRDPALLEPNPFVSEGMKRRARQASAPAQTAVETYDPYKGNWAAETTRAVASTQVNNLKALESLGRGLVGDQEGQRRAARRYLDRQDEIREMGPEVQTYDDARAAGGGVGDYIAATAFQGAQIGGDLAGAVAGGGVGGMVGRGVARRAAVRSVADSLETEAATVAARDAATKVATREAALAAPDGAQAVSNAMRVAKAQVNETSRKAAMQEAVLIAGRTPRFQQAVATGGRAGGLAGAAGASVPGVNAENAELLASEDTDQADAFKLAGGVALSSATAALPVDRFLGRFGAAARDEVAASAQRFLPRVAKEFGKQGLAEGAQETGQQAVMLASQHWVDKNIGLMDDAAIDAYMGSFLGGFFAGGVLGAAGETGRSGAALMSSGARKVMDAGGTLRDVIRERIATSADQRRAGDARPRPGEPMDGPAGAEGASVNEIFRRASEMGGKVGDALGAMGQSVASRFSSARDELAVDERVERVYQAWEQGGAPMVLGQRYNRLPDTGAELPGMQRFLMSYVSPNSAVWADDGLTARTGAALERLFRGAPNSAASKADQQVLDALVEGGHIDQLTLDSMRALAPEWAERASQASRFQPEEDAPDTQDDAQGTMAAQLRDAFAQRQAAADLERDGAQVDGGVESDAEGDLVNDALSEGTGRIGGADLTPAERLATLSANKASSEEIEVARQDLRRSLLGGEGKSGNSSLFVANTRTPAGEAEWRKVQAETKRTANRIEIEPVNVGDRVEMMRGRALSLDTLVTKYVNQIDQYDTSTAEGEAARAKAALFQVFADLKSAGIKVNPETITPGALGNNGRANNGTYIGRLTPRDAAELRAMWAPTKETPKQKRARADAARATAQPPMKKPKAPVTGEARQTRLDADFARTERQLNRDVAQGEHEIDSANADTMRLQDASLVQHKPLKAPPGAKVTEGSRAKEDPDRPGKNAPLNQSYVPTQGVADVRMGDRYGDVARAARKEAVDQGLASPEDVGPDGKPNTLTKIVGGKTLRPQPPSKRVPPQADPRFKAGVQIGLDILRKQHEDGVIRTRPFNIQVKRLTDPDSGLAMKYYNDAYHGKYVEASVTEQKADAKVDQQVDRRALADERRAERDMPDPKVEPPSKAVPTNDGKAAPTFTNKKPGTKRVVKKDAAADDLTSDLDAIAGQPDGQHDIKREQSMLDEVLKRLGLADYPIKLAAEPMRSRGRAGEYRPGMRTIVVYDHISGAERVEVLMHELGHHIVFAQIAKSAGIPIKDVPSYFDAASTAERFALLEKHNPTLYNALKQDYDAWVAANPRTQQARVTRMSRAPAMRALTVFNNDTKKTANELDPDAASYLYSFDEYLADNIARALTGRKEGRSVIRKFFGDIAQILQDTWRAMTGAEKREWAPAPSVDAWIKSLFNAERNAVRDATGTATTAKAAEGIVKAAATEQASTRLGGPVQYTRANVEELIEFIRNVMPSDERLMLERVLSRNEADKLIRDHFGAFPGMIDKLDDARAGMEWRLALGYLAWREGALTQTGPRAKQRFLDVREDLLRIAGLAGEGDIALRVLEDIADGTVQRYKDAGKTYSARRMEARARGNMQQALNWVSERGPISNGLAAFWTGVNQRMRDTGVPAIRELSAILQRPQGTTDDNEARHRDDLKNDRGLIVAIRNAQLKAHNRVMAAFADLDDGQRRRVLDLLQRGVKAGDPAFDSRSEGVRNAVTEMRKLLREEHALGVEMGMFDKGKQKVEDYFPVIMDLRHEHARERLTKLYAQDKFRTAVFDEFAVPERERTDEAHARLVKRLVDAAANDNQESMLGADGVLKGTRSQKHRLSQFVYKLGDANDKKVFASLQSKNIDEIFARHFAPMAKVIEFRRRFGELVPEVDESGNDVMRYDPRARLDALLGRARAQGATDKDIELAENAVKAAMGTYGVDVSPTLNAINPALAKKLSGPKTKAFIQGAQAYENVRLLPLAILSSLVDPMGIAVRSGGDFQQTWKGVREGMRKFTSKEAAADALRMLEELQLADDFMPAIASHPTFEGPQSPVARRVNEAVFKWNGMNAWVQATRVMAAHAGHGFLLKHAKGEGPHSRRYLAELSLKPEDIVEDPQHPGRVIVNDKTRPALQQFVDEAILRPNAMQAPLWHRDPYLGVVTQYKSFAYAIYDQITSRFAREVNQGNFRVLLAAGAYLPIVLFAELLREFIQHGSSGNPNREEWGADDYAMHAAARTGLMGPQFEVTSDLKEDLERNQLPGTSQLGPTMTQAKNVGDALQGRRDLGREVEAALPASSLWRKWNDEPASTEA